MSAVPEKAAEWKHLGYLLIHLEGLNHKPQCGVDDPTQVHVMSRTKVMINCSDCLEWVHA